MAAPLSTFDITRTEQEVTIEERGREELAVMGNWTLIPDGVRVKNYAFDATPMDLVTAIIIGGGHPAAFGYRHTLIPHHVL